MYICIYIHTQKWLLIWWLNSVAIVNGQRSSSIVDMTPDTKRRNQTWWPFHFTTWLKSFTSPICNQILVDLSQTENENLHLKFCSAQDDLCVLELMNKSVLCSYLNFQRTASSSFKNISGSVLSKNKKIGIKKCGSWLFQKPQKNLWVSWKTRQLASYLIFSTLLRTAIICQNWVFDLWEPWLCVLRTAVIITGP